MNTLNAYCTTIMNTILDELERRAKIREEGEKREEEEKRGEVRMETRREERRADKTKSRYSHTWEESLHVVTVTFFKCVIHEGLYGGDYVLLVHQLPTFTILDIKRSTNLEIIKMKVLVNKHIYFFY